MSVDGETPVIGVEEEAALGPAWHRWTRGLGFAFVGLVVVALVALLALGLLNKGESGAGVLGLSKEAPDFTLNLFDGGTFALSENRGTPVVVNFWASWCDSCREEAAALERSSRSLQEQGVIFVGVNVMDSRGDAEAFLEQFDVTYPNGPDESDIFFEYGATGTPETFFINRDGVIVLKYVGPMTEEQVLAFAEEGLR